MYSYNPLCIPLQHNVHNFYMGFLEMCPHVSSVLLHVVYLLYNPGTSLLGGVTPSGKIIPRKRSLHSAKYVSLSVLQFVIMLTVSVLTQCASLSRLSCMAWHAMPYSRTMASLRSLWATTFDLSLWYSNPLIIKAADRSQFSKQHTADALVWVPTPGWEPPKPAEIFVG